MKRFALVLLLAACGNRKFDIGVNAGAGGADVARMAASEVRMSRPAKDRRVDVRIAAMRPTARNEATPKQLGASLDTIIGDKHVNAIISRFVDQEVLALVPKMKSSGMPFLSTTAVPPGVVSGNGPGFSLVPGYAKQAVFLAHQAAATDKVAIVHIDDYYGNTLMTELVKALKDRGINVVAIKKFQQSWDEPRMVALGSVLQKEIDPKL
ncbi:MAG TPA: ABC transporter substrate-binding protein, partial [Longimicrobiales bacterium]|nr:ABC transporter substrate-binding protein [Longimicrobiales bacterium]